MPKIKTDKYELRRREVRAVMAAGQARANLSDEQLAVKIRKAKRTVQNRKRQPENFTLEELWELCDVLHLSNDDRVAILGGTSHAVT